MTTYRFEQIADNINVRVMPSHTDLDRYVGLEHLDPESLKIRRWGSPDEVIGQKLRFWKGDIVYGRRRAYQRKLAVADFDGICSAHAMVLRARPDVCLPEFFPFFLQSELFHQRAIEISVGSLSPTINWRTLAAQKFPLPPLNEQRRVADLLWAFDEVITNHQELVGKTEDLLSSKLRDVMQNRDWNTDALGRLALVERGKFAHRPRNLPKFYGGKYPFVQTGDIARCRGYLTTYEQTLSEEGRVLSRSFPPGTIMMTIAAVIGKTAITTFETWATDSVVGIVPKDIDVLFLEFYLRTQQPHLERVVATQTAQKNINLAILRPMQIPVPPKEEQVAISTQLLEIQNRIGEQEEHVRKSLELKQQLMNKMLSA